MSLFASLSDIQLDSFKEDSTKKFNNALFANGLWQQRKEPVGTFTIKVEDIDGSKYGLKNKCEFDFESALPKIPAVIFFNILQFYREIYVKMKSEVYVSIYWDKVKQDYFLYVPKQKVSGAVVVFENDTEMLNNPDIFIVMDNHSHNVMNAFWSGQDIKDQAGSRLFGVIGKINDEAPQYLLTAGANRQEKQLDFDEVFDRTVDKLHEDSDYSLPANAFDQVTEQVYTPPLITTYGKGKRAGGNAYVPPKSYTGYEDDDYDYNYGGNYKSNYSYSVYSDKNYLDLTKHARNLYDCLTYQEVDVTKFTNAFVDFLFENMTTNKPGMSLKDTQDVLSNVAFSVQNTCEEIITELEALDDKGDNTNVSTPA